MYCFILYCIGDIGDIGAAYLENGMALLAIGSIGSNWSMLAVAITKISTEPQRPT